MSRGRRPKKAGKPKRPKNPSNTYRMPSPPESALAGLVRNLGGNVRPDWFDPAIERVFAGAVGLTSAHGPQELDHMVAELLGAELYQALQIGWGLRFGWWFSELVDTAVERTEQRTGAEREAAFWLLQGLAAQCENRPAELLRRARKAMRQVPAGRLPDWLVKLPDVAATGKVLRLRDAYGTRLAVIAEYDFPDSAGTSWFLFDIDASGFINLVDAGAYDEAEEAAAAWRAEVGDDEAVAAPVGDPADLLCLVQLDTGEMMIRGSEPRRVMDNWFRAPARIDDLGRKLRAQGRALPTATSLHHDLDITVLTEPFIQWYLSAHGTAPDQDIVEALAAEWMEGALPETRFSASPERIRFLRDLINDWHQDDPVTRGVIALMPEWVRWLGERGDLGSHRVVHLVEVAGEDPRWAQLQPPAR